MSALCIHNNLFSSDVKALGIKINNIDVIVQNEEEMTLISREIQIQKIEHSDA